MDQETITRDMLRVAMNTLAFYHEPYQMVPYHDYMAVFAKDGRKGHEGQILVFLMDGDLDILPSREGVLMKAVAVKNMDYGQWTEVREE